MHRALHRTILPTLACLLAGHCATLEAQPSLTTFPVGLAHIDTALAMSPSGRYVLVNRFSQSIFEPATSYYVADTGAGSPSNPPTFPFVEPVNPNPLAWWPAELLSPLIRNDGVVFCGVSLGVDPTVALDTFQVYALNPLVNPAQSAWSTISRGVPAELGGLRGSASSSLVGAQIDVRVGSSALVNPVVTGYRYAGGLSLTPGYYADSLLAVGTNARGLDSLIARSVVLSSNGLSYSLGPVCSFEVDTGLTTPIANPPADLYPYFASEDGRTIVGKQPYPSTSATQWVRWRADTGVQALDTLGYDMVEVVGISANGATIVGNARRAGITEERRTQGLIWRNGAPGGDLWNVLPSSISPVGAINTAWTTLCGISSDGSIVAGTVEWPSQAGPPSSSAFRAVLPPGVGENCANPIPATYGTVTASTRGADRSANPPAGTTLNEGSAPDIFFRFVPVASESVIIDTCGSDFDTTLVVTTLPGGCGTLGTLVGWNDDGSPSCSTNVYASRVQCFVQAGQTYWIRVSGFNGTRGGVQLNITAPNRPSNDGCATPIEVQPGTSVAFSTASAITDSQPPICSGGFTLFSDVWFTSVAPDAGSMTFDTCGGPVNFGLDVYPASACATPVSPIRCSTAGCSSGGSLVTVPCAAGERFLVRVGGLFGAVGSGTFTARFSCDAPVFDAYRAAVMADNPTGFWRFNDSGRSVAADQQRTLGASNQCGDYPGQYSVAAGRAASGLWGAALQLDGGSGRVMGIGAPPPAPDSNCGSAGVYTLEAWIKTVDPAAGIVMTQRGGAGDQSLTLSVGYSPLGSQAGKVIFALDGPGVFTGAISSTSIIDGRWHHVVGVRNFFPFNPVSTRWQYQIFFDGVLQGTNNYAGTGSRTPVATNSANPWVIGYGPAVGVGFKGLIDEAALYCGVALSASRVAAHFNTGNVQPPPENIPPTALAMAGPIAWNSNSYQFTVTYTDNVAVDVSSLSSSNVRITSAIGTPAVGGPFNTLANLISLDNPTNGTPRVATYVFVPPGGAWDPLDAGTYTISMEPNQVRDTAGNFVPAGQIGQLTFAQPVLIDGSGGPPDTAYGDPIAVQRTQTGFGDSNVGSISSANGSELDAMYAHVEAGVLYLLLAGNLENNHNSLEIFFDTHIGGQHRLLGNNADLDGNGLNRMGDDGSGNGLRFDAAFDADYYICYTCGGSGASFAGNVYWAQLFTAGGGPGLSCGASTVFGNGILGGGNNPFGIRAVINNSNDRGVTAGNGRGFGDGVTTGVELAIPLAALGNPTCSVRVCAFINGVGHGYLSNQVLPPLRPQEPSYIINNLTEARSVNFDNFASDQFAEIYITPPGGFLAPLITQQPPAILRVPPGGMAVLSIVATSPSALSYQWSKDGDNIPGGTGPTLVISPMTAADQGVYRCAVERECGRNISSPSQLSLLLPCSVADIVAVGGLPPPDGILTGDDFNAFIAAFSNDDPLADIVSVGGVPPPDGIVSGDDFNAFIAAFAAGCP